MKTKIYSLFAILTLSVTAWSQGVGVNETGNNPNPNAILDVSSTNKGLLLPRVALSATNNAAPLSAHVAGMKVYNTATAGTAPNDVTPGEYYNDGTKWVKISTSAPVFNPTRTVYVNVADPNSATLWDEDVRYLIYDVATAGCIVNPAFVDDPTLAANTSYLYVGQSTCAEGDLDPTVYSFWIYNGTTYVPLEGEESTAWYLGNTNADAGSSKTNMIRRPGSVIVGQGPVFEPRVKLYSYYETSLDANAAINAGKILYAGINHINHTGTLPQTAIYGTHSAAHNYSTTALPVITGNSVDSRNFGGNITNLYGSTITLSNQATATGNVNNMSGTLSNVIHSAPGTVNLMRGLNYATTISTTGGAVNTIQGIVIAATNNSTSGAGVNVTGGEFRADNRSTATGTVSNQKGIYGLTSVSTTQANITNNYGGHIQNTIQTAFGGVITNNYGLRIQNTRASGATGTITNQYGLYLDNLTTGITGQHWAMFSTGTAPSSFGGTLRVSANLNEIQGVNHLYGPQGLLNLGSLRSSGNPYLARGMKADPVNGNLYVSNSNTNISRTAIEQGNGFIRFIGQTAAETVAVDAAITAPAEIMRMDALTGNVGIGVVSPSHILHINGQGRATNSAWATTSDRRLKENIEEYKLGINELMKIKTYEYNYKSGIENMSKEEQERRRVGIMAQEIEEILPRTITTIQENGLTDQRLFNNDELIYLLINAIKDQQKQIEELKAKIELLKK